MKPEQSSKSTASSAPSDATVLADLLKEFKDLKGKLTALDDLKNDFSSLKEDVSGLKQTICEFGTESPSDLPSFVLPGLSEAPRKKSIALPFSGTRQKTSGVAHSPSNPFAEQVLLKGSKEASKVMEKPSVTQGASTSVFAKTLPDPEIFDGRNPKLTKQFLMKCELIFNSSPQEYNSGHSKVAYAATRLSGEAFDVYSTYHENEDFTVLGDWENFKRVLHGAFGDKTERQEAQMQLLSLRMHGKGQKSLSVWEYTRKFNMLRRKTTLDDVTLYDRYLIGLSEEIHNSLLGPHKLPSTLQELQECAIHNGHLIQERAAVLKLAEQVSPAPVANNPPTPQNPSVKSPSGQPAQQHQKTKSEQPKKPSAASLPADKPLGFWAAKKLGICMYCRSKEHSSNQCPQKPPFPPKTEKLAAVKSEENASTPTSTSSGNVKGQ